jgi:hypothetical protein
VERKTGVLTIIERNVKVALPALLQKIGWVIKDIGRKMPTLSKRALTVTRSRSKSEFTMRFICQEVNKEVYVPRGYYVEQEFRCAEVHRGRGQISNERGLIAQRLTG